MKKETVKKTLFALCWFLIGNLLVLTIAYGDLHIKYKKLKQELTTCKLEMEDLKNGIK